jgi:hypothetical protein
MNIIEVIFGFVWQSIPLGVLFQLHLHLTDFAVELERAALKVIT